MSFYYAQFIGHLKVARHLNAGLSSVLSFLHYTYRIK